jgi:hypothetical protein
MADQSVRVACALALVALGFILGTGENTRYSSAQPQAPLAASAAVSCPPPPPASAPPPPPAAPAAPAAVQKEELVCPDKPCDGFQVQA